MGRPTSRTSTSISLVSAPTLIGFYQPSAHSLQSAACLVRRRHFAFTHQNWWKCGEVRLRDASLSGTNRFLNWTLSIRQMFLPTLILPPRPPNHSTRRFPCSNSYNGFFLLVHFNFRDQDNLPEFMANLGYVGELEPDTNGLNMILEQWIVQSRM